jgi:hypothetical protein
MRSRVNLAILLVLAACSGSGGWSKPGVPRDKAAADLGDCRHLAQQALSRESNIDADIMASRGADWARTGALESERYSDSRSTATRSSAIIDACMMDKGYLKPR